MKTYIAILLLSCLYSWNAASQEIVEFKKSELDKSVFLSIKDKVKKSQFLIKPIIFHLKEKVL